MQNLPILSVFAVIGLIAAVILGFVEKGSAPETGVLAVALIIGVAADIADNHFGPIVSAPAERHMLGDFISKLIDYWIPFVLIFPVGLLFALIHDRVSRPLALFAVLTILNVSLDAGRKSSGL